MYFTEPKKNIGFIKSGCTLLDLVLGGGWAMGRTVNIVGDKSTGKTLLAMEALANFIAQYAAQGGRAIYKECEGAFDIAYAQEGLGIPMDQVELDQGGITTVEDLMRDVDTMAEENAKRKGKGPPPPILYVVDSLDAISDEAEMDREVGKGNYGAAKAKMLSEFFRTRNQALHQGNVCLMIISQIRENLNAGMFGKKFLRSGGKGLDFFASQVMWLYNVGKEKRTFLKQERVTGVKIKAKNDKNKVSTPYRECDFEIEFGYGVQDEQASRAFLKDVGSPADATISKAELDALVIAKWYDIEKAILPKHRKYEG